MNDERTPRAASGVRINKARLPHEETLRGKLNETRFPEEISTNDAKGERKRFEFIVCWINDGSCMHLRSTLSILARPIVFFIVISKVIFQKLCTK